MIERENLGKISHISFGMGGYQDAQLGITFTLEGKGWGVCDFWGYWASDPSPSAKWTKKDQIEQHGRTVERIGKLLTEVKVKDINKLIGKPIVATVDGSTLKEWRILTEVL